MSFFKQALLSLVVILVAAGGWYGYTNRADLLNRLSVMTSGLTGAGTPSPANQQAAVGNAAPGAQNGAPAAANGGPGGQQANGQRAGGQNPQGAGPNGAGPNGVGPNGANQAAQNNAGAPAGAANGQRPGAAGGQGGAPGGFAGGAGGPGGFAGGARPLVVTAPVVFQAIGDDLEAVGSAAAIHAVTILSQVTGIIGEAPLKPGDKVAKGDVIVRLINEDQKVALEKAKVNAADFNYAAERAEQLNQAQNITQVALTTARSNAQKGQIDLRTAQLDLERRTILAPFDGVVGIFTKTPGDYVTPALAITTLDDTSKFIVAFDAPERFAGRLVLGQKVTATAEGILGQVMKGDVTSIDSRVDEAVRTFKVQATLDQGIAGLKPGMSVKVAATFGTATQPTVPSLAVLWDRAGSYVWRLDGDQVRRTPIDIVSRRNGLVVVMGPLRETDLVVTEGLQRLRDGIAVTRAPGEAPPARAADAPAGPARPGANGANNNGEGARPPAAATDQAPRPRGQT